MIADVQFLREYGVSKMVRLPVVDLTKQYPDEDEYLFLIKPQLSVVTSVIEAIRYMVYGVVSLRLCSIWGGGGGVCLLGKFVQYSCPGMQEVCFILWSSIAADIGWFVGQY